MAPVKKLTKEQTWQEYIHDVLDLDSLPWVEVTEPDLEDNQLPEIVDVLGCFCEQTGAQFG